MQISKEKKACVRKRKRKTEREGGGEGKKRDGWKGIDEVNLTVLLSFLKNMQMGKEKKASERKGKERKGKKQKEEKAKWMERNW